jgi:hypothetical protein
MRLKFTRVWWGLSRLFLLGLLLAGCQDRGPDDLPTRIPSVEELATHEVLTANAPPPGFRDTVSFAEIDADMHLLPNWHSEALMRFEGVFSGTSRPVDITTRADIWYNQISQHRRVVIEGGGALLGQDESTRMEGVRLGEDTFLIRENSCLDNAGEQAATVADLRVFTIIGGVVDAVPGGVRAIVNGEEVWRYDFTADDLRLEPVMSTENGRVELVSGELWVAPARDAVIRYYANLEVENVVLTLVDNALPVSGRLIIRYDVYDIGTDPNITRPFGC